MPLLLDNADAEALLDPGELVEALESAYRAFARGAGVSAPRQDLQAPPTGKLTYQLGLTAGMIGRYAALRLKSDMTYLVHGPEGARKEKYCVEPGLYCGLILLFSTETGVPLALIKDGVLQRMRVGADSAIGARLMARGDARTLGLLGSGGMAYEHLRAMVASTGIRNVVVYSPTPANRERLAEHARSMGLQAEAVESSAAVTAEADILCACTNSTGPVVLGSDLRRGTHVTAIGGRLDSAASACIDRWLRLGLATPAPEWGGTPIEEECLTFSASGTKAASGGSRRFSEIPVQRRVLLSGLLDDPTQGRSTETEITFSDRGNVHGLQFAAAAGLFYERALEAGRGQVLPLDNFLQTVRN